MIYLYKFKVINVVVLTITMLLLKEQAGFTKSINKQAKLTQADRIVKGQSGGSIDSHGCGFIADRPNYEMSLEQRSDYMRLTVRAAGGQPTLLVLGPNSGESFCVLGDETSGLKPEISGVWESGNYQIFIGDLLGNQHEFILDISTDN